MFPGEKAASPVSAYTIACFRRWENPWRAQFAKLSQPDFQPLRNEPEPNGPLSNGSHSSNSRHTVILKPPTKTPLMAPVETRPSMTYLQRNTVKPRPENIGWWMMWRQFLINVVTLRTSRGAVRAAAKLFLLVIVMLGLVAGVYSVLLPRLAVRASQ